MLIHHILTMALSALMWHHGQLLVSTASPDNTFISAALAISAMEAGSFGFGVGVIYADRPLARRLYALFITASHFVVLAVGFGGCLAPALQSPHMWATMLATLPLIQQRHSAMVTGVGWMGGNKPYIAPHKGCHAGKAE